MDKSSVTIRYKTAEGKRICVEVSTAVKELLEQSDRQMRSQSRQDRRHLDSKEYIDELVDTTSAYPQEDFADLVTRIDRTNRLYAAIETLSKAQKRRLCQYYFAELSYRQIAKIESVNHKSVARSVEQAVGKLRKYIIE